MPSSAILAAGERELTGRFRAQLQSGDAALRAQFEATGNAGALLRERTRLINRLLRELWKALAMPADCALVAVGGYGRGELFPHSDVDLLFLTAGALSEPAQASLVAFVSTAWDIGLELGHSVRTVEQCVDEAARDITVQTNLTESRQLAGARSLYRRFAEAIRAGLEPQTFYSAKRLEQEERYTRFNETPYALEPNCKESPGGLRDLQTILWISNAAGLGARWADLARHGLVTRAEMAELSRLLDFVRLTRIRLHYLARRREDRLVFDHQEALARAFGVEATAVRRASEVFMQRYYRNAKSITQLNTILMQNLGAMLTPGPRAVPFVINERFQAERDLLDVRDEGVFDRQPAAILESFLIMEQRSELKGMSARTLRALWRARTRVNAAFRADPAHRALFLSLLQQKHGILHEFRRMNQWGILGRYLPAFGRIVGQMQHDLFHVYTVDQHILQVLRNVRRFTTTEHAHEYPLCSRLISGFERPWLIYLGALFHDIAKGRQGDHSLLGREDAAEFCRDHGLSEEDTEMVVFLVGHHLTMSNVAQKQDLGDPAVIQAFADLVRTERRLTALYLLTVADIRGTSPKVWNNWKGKLLEDLYYATRRLLRGATPQQALGMDERQEDARRILRYHGLRPDVEQPLWRELDTVYFMRHDAEEIAWHTRMLYYRVAAEQPVVKARVTHIDDGLQVMVYTPDQPELFARLCGFFARLGYSIVDAKIHTTRHGYALDSFILLDPTGHFVARDMISLIEHDLVERLERHAPLDQPVSVRLSRQVKHFPITPEVTIEPDERGSHWVLSVAAADRPGLLFAIAQVLAQHGIDLHTAKIATLGERVEDTFLVSGAELKQTSTLLRLEQELLERLRV